jgi:membrane-associated protein
MNPLDLLTDFLLAAVNSPWVYLVVFAVVVIDGFFPPVPSESIVVVAAALGVSTGTADPVAIVVLAAVGAALGDTIAYGLGRRIGATRFSWMRGHRAAAAIDNAGQGLARRPASMLLVARYIPVGRVAVNMTAGATRLPFRRFWPLTGLAGACWSVYSVLIGIVAGNAFTDQPVLGAMIGVVLALCLGLGLDRLVTGFRRRRDRLAVSGVTALGSVAAPDTGVAARTGAG